MIKNIQRAKDDGKREKTALPPFFPSHRLPRAFFLSLQSPYDTKRPLRRKECLYN